MKEKAGDAPRYVRKFLFQLGNGLSPTHRITLPQLSLGAGRCQASRVLLARM
ncbi:hypothetical protein [Longimicrobium sp.]|uniref:hypothetical protein n=1 Tax=Longimicrobium sp. TaxID=2029185 RepID=UPI002BDFBFE8|nr:hypothetical protein [Longimicrobium sp.]HSU16742.1 hypothetical protein [Longimicrobium sp.]